MIFSNDMKTVFQTIEQDKKDHENDVEVMRDCSEKIWSMYEANRRYRLIGMRIRAGHEMSIKMYNTLLLK